jgi:hypothetical protein
MHFHPENINNNRKSSTPHLFLAPELIRSNSNPGMIITSNGSKSSDKYAPIANSIL